MTIDPFLSFFSHPVYVTLHRFIRIPMIMLKTSMYQIDLFIEQYLSNPCI